MKLVKPFSITNSTNKYAPTGNLKKRENREFCNLHFCLENGCSDAFDSQLELEQHVLSNQYNFSTIKSGMDKVKMSFINHMKKSSNAVTPFTVEPRSVQQKTNEISCLNQFSETGWALPVRQKFRFSSNQKKTLYKYFIDGETSGKKFSAQQVHLLIRRELDVDEYVTCQQIKSLFSRWSRMEKDELLNKNSNEDDSKQDDDNDDIIAEGLLYTCLLCPFFNLGNRTLNLLSQLNLNLCLKKIFVMQ